MKKRLLCILLCILLFATSILTVQSSKNKKMVQTVSINGVQPYSMVQWTEIQKLYSSDINEGDLFGCSVSLDGDYALIGVKEDNDNGGSSGSAYVFFRNGTTWTQQAKLLASDGTKSDLFGNSVSLYGDTALVGASGVGSVYIFIRNNTSWTQQQKISFSENSYGFPISLYGDYAFIGLPHDYFLGGAAYILKRTGSTWSKQQKLFISDGVVGDSFGFSVSLYGDTAFIGVPNDDNNTGSVYVFTHNGTTWTQHQKLTASDGIIMDLFGNSVSVHGDYALISAPGKNLFTGAAYFFKHIGDDWYQVKKVVAEDHFIYQMFGYSISFDGYNALIGAVQDHYIQGCSGAAYIFTRTGTTWTQKAKLKASDAELFDYFGISVALDGYTALIGAECDDNNWIDNGAVYVFTKEAENPPHPPIIAGPNGKPGNPYDYYFISIDPEGDDVFYYIDWDDGLIENWIGPYKWGEIINITHTWTDEGTYVINAKAKDVYGEESDWSQYTVTMPRTRAIDRPLLNFLQNFLQSYPNLFPILQKIIQIMGLQ